MGGKRRAVGPFGVFAQMESVFFAVFGDVPFFGHTGNNVGGGIFGRESFKQIAQDVRAGYAFHNLRIQALRFGTIATAQNHFRVRGKAGEQCGGNQAFAKSG